MITDAAAQSLLADLVRIDSVTPWLIPDGAGEAEAAAFVAAWVEDLPVEVTLEEIAPGRVNTLVRLRGAEPGPTLCVNAHIDTVGYANWRDRALTPEIQGDRMIGLGTADDKAGCVAALLALRELVETGATLRGDLLLALVADEEGVSIGTEALLAAGDLPDAMLIVEPDDVSGRVVVEHQGFGWIDVIVHGKPAHGSAPDEGVDAIVHMAEVVQRLHRLDADVFAANPDPMNGRTVFHTGTIRGGTDYATYPGSAVLGIEIGTQPGEHLSDRVRDIEAIFDEVRAIDPRFSGEVVVQLDREPFRAEGHEALQAALDGAAEEVRGAPLTRLGMNAWADSGLTQAAGIPTLMFGPNGGNFHAPDEWVSIPEVAESARMVEGTVRRFLA
jgi:acetylornithine deacetylase/succinyl-diaminopimelate desuccinylase-like protein